LGAIDSGPGEKNIESKKKNEKGVAVKMRKKFFVAALLALFALILAGPAMAEEEGSAVGKFMDFGLAAAGLGMGLATFGGAMAQGRASSAALEGIARNPGAADRMFVPMILGLVLIESLVIYSLVVEILILVKWSP